MTMTKTKTLHPRFRRVIVRAQSGTRFVHCVMQYLDCGYHLDGDRFTCQVTSTGQQRYQASLVRALPETRGWFF